MANVWLSPHTFGIKSNQGKLSNRDLYSLGGASYQNVAEDKMFLELDFSGGQFYAKMMY